MTGAAHVFFFEAEDGIRGTSVTGVQTCALPISCPAARGDEVKVACRDPGRQDMLADLETRQRSEERRVGKECRGRWRPAHQTNDERSEECVRAEARAGRKRQADVGAHACQWRVI